MCEAKNWYSLPCNLRDQTAVFIFFILNNNNCTKMVEWEKQHSAGWEPLVPFNVKLKVTSLLVELHQYQRFDISSTVKRDRGSLNSLLPLSLKHSVIFHFLFLQTPTGKPCYTCFISIFWHWWSKRASPEAICEITETTESSECCQHSLWASTHCICLFPSLLFPLFCSNTRKDLEKSSNILSPFCCHLFVWIFFLKIVLYHIITSKLLLNAKSGQKSLVNQLITWNYIKLR